MSEYQEAKKLTQYLRMQGFLFCHIPNEAKRSFQLAAMLKASGMQKGAPDYLIFNPINNFVGVAIELKRPISKSKSKPKVSPEQINFLHQLEKYNWRAVICYGAIEAINFLERLYK